MKRRSAALRRAVWRLPLRLKVAIWTGLLVGLAQLLIAGGIVAHLYLEGLEQLDKDLSRAARHFFRELETSREKIDWTNSAQVERMFSADGEPYFAEISDTSGTVLHRSRLMERAELNSVVAGADPITMRIRGKPLRLAAYEQSGLRVLVGVSAYLVFETREDVLRTFLVTCPIALLLVGLGGWWIAGRALAPVAEVTAAAEAITAERLDQRLPTPPANDEIGRLTAVLNSMIDRLEQSFHQARRFSADASHELRTPLTILRGEIENALRARELTADHERLLLDLLEEVEGLSKIMEGLLLLSRADAGRLQLERAPVDMSRLLHDIIEDAEILAAAEDIRIENRVTDGVTVEGYEPFLRQVALNLVENAVKYNRPQGVVRLELSAQEKQAVLSIGNTGEGISAEQAEQIFKRFYRGRAAHEGPRRGHGLGLSICREIARAHHGEISLVRSEADWTEFRFSMPLADGKSVSTTAELRPPAVSSAWIDSPSI